VDAPFLCSLQEDEDDPTICFKKLHDFEYRALRERERERERGGNAGGAYLFVVLHCFSIFCEVVEGRNCVCVLACVFVCHVVASVAR